MNKPKLRAVILSALAIGIVPGAALPAWANHTGFDKAEYQVGESDEYVELTVVSAPCCPPPGGQVDYYTANSTALAGKDYVQTSGTLTVPAEGTIRVPIVNDELFEGEEQFEVRLTNYRGISVPDRTTAIVRILDDDPKPSSSSTSLTRSPEQTARSAGGSSARPPSPPSAASGSSDAGGQSARVTTPTAESTVHQDVAPPAETDDRDHAKAIVPKSERGKGDDSSLVLVALGTLLLVLGAGLWMKKKLGRRLT